MGRFARRWRANVGLAGRLGIANQQKILFLAQPMSRTRVPQMLNFGSGRGPRRRTCECSPVPCLYRRGRWTRSAACCPSPTFLLFAEETAPLNVFNSVFTQLGAPLAWSQARRSLTWPWPPRRGQKVGDVTHYKIQRRVPFRKRLTLIISKSINYAS